MPTETLIVLALILFAFAAFAGTLFGADLRTRKAHATSRVNLPKQG